MTRPIQQTNVHGIRMMAFSVMGHNGKTILTIEEVRRNCMSHFTAEYMDRVSAILHNVLTPTWFYKQEIIEIPGLVTAVFITYDGLRDDSREIRDQCSWQDFQQRLLAISDWGLEPEFLKEMIQKNSAMVMGGWQRRTIYLMRAGSRPEHWTADKANEDVLTLLMSSAQTTGKVLQMETEHLREIIPPGPDHFRAFEHIVRVVFNYLFIGELGEGKAQSRTQPEDEGVEIRDVIFANNAESGFWNDLNPDFQFELSLRTSGRSLAPVSMRVWTR